MGYQSLCFDGHHHQRNAMDSKCHILINKNIINYYLSETDRAEEDLYQTGAYLPSFSASADVVVNQGYKKWSPRDVIG